MKSSTVGAALSLEFWSAANLGKWCCHMDPLTFDNSLHCIISLVAFDQFHKKYFRLISRIATDIQINRQNIRKIF